MKRNVLVRSLLLPVFIFGMIGFTQAQDINEAKEAYNNALKLATDDPSTAIASIKQCLEICDQIGEEGDDIKVLAENKLPELYFNVGNNLIKENKITQAIPAYQEALKVAEQYKNEEVIIKSKSMLPRLYNAVGGTYYKNSDFDKALEALNKAIVYDPDYAKAYYTMGLVYKKLEDPVNFETTADKGLTAADNSKDSKTKDLIQKSANNFFLATGTDAYTGGKAAESVELLKKALKYDPDMVETYFYIASAYNELKKFDESIAASTKALELEGEDQEKNAKHFYNLGMSYKGKGDKSAACEAFNKALFGQFKENAKYEIEHGIKCNE
jgi:superkiller protein 3